LLHRYIVQGLLGLHEFEFERYGQQGFHLCDFLAKQDAVLDHHCHYAEVPLVNDEVDVRLKNVHDDLVLGRELKNFLDIIFVCHEDRRL
jgi:hypothetical protein